MAQIEFIEKRTGAVVKFTPERITNAIYRAAVAVGGRDRSVAERLSAQVVKILEERSTPGHIPTVEEIQDLVEKVLIENGHAKVAKAYILYRDERARQRQARAERASQPSQNIPWAKLWHILDWAVDQGVNTIAGLNERIQRGELSQIVRASEAMYEEDIENAAEMIGEKRNTLKVVLVSGPSSSGKTTTTIKLAQRLRKMKIKLVTLNVDNYFFDLALHPKDEFGDYDFETPQALDLELISKHLAQLASGKEVMIPFYDFKTGLRHNDQTPLRMKSGEMLLIDSLHGLYPPMTAGIEDEQKFKLYLEPLMQMKDATGKYIRWADLRLIRRMLRDASHRGYNMERTLEHWHYVRTSELRNIIPNVSQVDSIVNSAMPYEVCLYRARLLDQFAEWKDRYRDDPLHTDAFERSDRVYQMLSQVHPVQDESVVPTTSVIREFIGGSTLKY